MQTDQQFHMQRDAYERGVLKGVRQLTYNADATALIAGRLPFVNKTRSFIGTTVFGLEKVEPRPDPWSAKRDVNVGVRYFARNEIAGDFDITKMPREFATMLMADLENIASYQGNVYLVTSYGTVIAWTRDVHNSGALVIPRVDYSQTTTRHQEITLSAGGRWIGNKEA